MSQVRIILREKIYRLGAAGDVVSVKPGYARNFLLPQGKAVLATRGKVQEIEHQQRVIGDRRAKELKDLEALKIRMEAVVLEFEAQVGEEGKLFGSVTAQQLADQLAEKGQVVDRRKISLEEPIRSVGEHTVSIRLQGDVTADVKVIVKAID
ncbi:MAG TPA: 50S ribosomal protein L9 [Myxococcales bacterium]|jgi:large subunit ribosomal protein L9|nr:50S ribosomal protein L9 [Myxococcales bacterium]HIL81563.1 50S ribosomal protein L9 [Myxococcales bacterium]